MKFETACRIALDVVAVLLVTVLMVSLGILGAMAM